jgi:2',3'-cyclic-nucleotide 2'-phosphodiesterase (5'-nucleotidase family)
MRRLFIPLAAFLLTPLLFFPFRAAANEPRHLTLLFTNDVQGYIEPCG